jgi:hypothetical protein
MKSNSAALALTPYHCNKVDLFSQEEPSDVTSSIECKLRAKFYSNATFNF